ncbi:hypothetical protein [Streptomyces sp. NPDC002845]
MTRVVHICRYCDEPISDPQDAVQARYQPSMSGPGWIVWAHRAHAPLVQPDPTLLYLLLRIRLAKARQA